MTKQAHFEETDFWKGASTASGGLIALLGGILYKISLFFIKQKNDELAQIRKDVSSLASKIDKMENSLVVHSSAGDIPLNRYVQHMNHNFGKADEKFTGILDAVLKGDTDEFLQKLEEKYKKHNDQVHK